MQRRGGGSQLLLYISLKRNPHFLCTVNSLSRFPFWRNECRQTGKVVGEGCAEPHWGKEIWREEVSRQPRSVAQTYTHTHYSKEREKDRFYFTKEAEFPNPNCALIIKSLMGDTLHSVCFRVIKRVSNTQKITAARARM